MMSDYYYIDVSLILSEKCDSVVPIFIKGSIEESLRKTFGEIGGQVDRLDILKFITIKSSELNKQKIVKFILRTTQSDYVKVRAALTLIAKFQGISCYFKVNGVSSFLPSLIGVHIQF